MFNKEEDQQMKVSSNVESKQKALANKPNPANTILRNKVAVFPFIIRSGFVNLTEKGYVDRNAEPSNYGFFQKLFIGNESIIATWENSTSLIKPQNKNYYEYDFHLGLKYFGQVIDGMYNKSIEVEDVNIDGDFMGMKYSSNITLRFNVNQKFANADSNFYPYEMDMFKLYTIPQLSLNKWYYISNVETIYNDANTEIIMCEVTFSSLDDKLQQSGYAVEQYINYAAPGEPYAKPIIEYLENGSKEIILDPNCLNVSGIKYIQIELEGANALSGVQVQGRDIVYSDTGKQIFYANKFLLPQKFVLPQNNNLSTKSTPTQNFFYFPDEMVSFTFNQDFVKQFKEVNDSVSTVDNSGVFTLGALANWDDLHKGIHKSNNTTPRTSIIDPVWAPLQGIGWTNTYGVVDNAYVSENLTYGTNSKANEILAMNGIANMSYPTLPLSMASCKPYYLSNIPIIGGLLSMFVGDAYLGSPDNGKRVANRVGYFMDADIAGMLANVKVGNDSANTITGRVESFIGAIGADNVPKYLGVGSLRTTICFKLTDVCTTYTWDNKKYENFNTEWIGQTFKKYNNDENKVLVNTDGSKTYFKSQVANFIDTDKAFIIDQITVTALTAGNIKITCYSDNMDSQWTTTVKSNGNWTGNIRDWMTVINTGGWDDSWTQRTDNFTWPTGYNGATGEKVLDGELRIYNNQNILGFGGYNSSLNIDENQPEWLYNGIGGNYRHIITSKLRTYRVNYLEVSPYSNKTDFLANNNKIIINADNYFNVGVSYLANNPENKDIANDERGWVQSGRTVSMFDLKDAEDQQSSLYKNINHNNTVSSAHMLNKTLKKGDFYNGQGDNVSIRTMNGWDEGDQTGFEVKLWCEVDFYDDYMEVHLKLVLEIPKVAEEHKRDGHYIWSTWGRKWDFLAWVGLNAKMFPEFKMFNIKLSVV